MDKKIRHYEENYSGLWTAPIVDPAELRIQIPSLGIDMRLGEFTYELEKYFTPCDKFNRTLAVENKDPASAMRIYCYFAMAERLKDYFHYWNKDTALFNYFKGGYYRSVALAKRREEIKTLTEMEEQLEDEAERAQ